MAASYLISDDNFGRSAPFQIRTALAGVEIRKSEVP